MLTLLFEKTFVPQTVFFLIYIGFLIFEKDCLPKVENKLFYIGLSFISAIFLLMLLFCDQFLIDAKGYGNSLTAIFAIVFGFTILAWDTKKAISAFPFFLFLLLAVCIGYAWYFSSWFYLLFVVFSPIFAAIVYFVIEIFVRPIVE